ncbi:MAG: hypothetical protein PBV01_10375 [Brucella anthropi]
MAIHENHLEAEGREWNDRVAARKAEASKVEDGVAVTMQAPGYESLARILGEAFVQSAFGKGKERHANDEPFDDQPINTIPKLLGDVGIGGPTNQVIKKTQEAVGMYLRGKHDAAIAEMLGVIVYAAGTIRFIETSMKSKSL